MWKKIHRKVAVSEKHGAVSHLGFRVWTMVLPWTDCFGRYSGDVKLIKAQCMPLLDVRLEQVDAALVELDEQRLFHLYHVGSKRFLVLHDHKDWGSTLKYMKAEWPAPHPGLCECASDDANDVHNVVSHSPSLSHSQEEGGPLMLLMQRAKDAKIAAIPSSLRTFLEAWVARSSSGRVEQILMDPWSRGKTLIEIQNHFWPLERRGNGEVPFKAVKAEKPADPECRECRGKGTQYSAVTGVTMVCRCAR